MGTILLLFVRTFDQRREEVTRRDQLKRG
jgi:hypothetical protein